MEKSKIIKARRRRNFFENNKNLTRFLSDFLKIIKTYAKIRSPKILKGGVLIIYTPVDTRNFGNDSVVQKLQLFEVGRISEFFGRPEKKQTVFETNRW